MKTERLGDTLLVPVEGLFEVFMYKVSPPDLLTGPGRYAQLHTGDTDVHFRINEDAPINTRAATILTRLSQFTMVLTGPVVFTGIPGDELYEIIQHPNKEGTQE